MARTREQVLQEQLGAMAFQIALLTADLEAAKEQVKTLTDAAKPAPPPES